MSRLIEEDRIQLTQIHWSDEANFRLSGHVNKHNIRFWAMEKPDLVNTVKFRCAITYNRVIGPYFPNKMTKIR